MAKKILLGETAFGYAVSKYLELSLREQKIECDRSAPKDFDDMMHWQENKGAETYSYHCEGGSIFAYRCGKLWITAVDFDTKKVIINHKITVA